MAFGKRPDSFNQTSAQLGRAAPQPAGGNFRQQSGALSHHTRGPRRNLPYFVDMYQPSTSIIDTVRLVPGNYIQEQLIGEGDKIECVTRLSQFIKFTEHFDGVLQVGTICSAGAWSSFPTKRKPCYGCDIYWDTYVRNAEGKGESTRMSRQDKFAFSVFSYSKYHNMPQLDKTTGAPKMNERTGKPYMNLTKCTGPVCEGCRTRAETKVGNMTHWPMNYTQLQILRAASANIGQSCSRCGTADCINSLTWMCAGCGEHIIRMDTTNFTMEEIQTITDNPYTCQQCEHVGFLEELLDCPECTRRGQMGVRASIFDVDLKVQLVPGTSGNNAKTLQVAGWSLPGLPVPEFAAQLKPVDLLSRYQPDTLARQAERFHVAPGQPAGQPTAQDTQGQPTPNRQPVTDVNAPPFQNPYATTRS